MRLLPALLIAMTAFSNLPARAESDWILTAASKAGCRFYTMKQDFSGRFRNYLVKTEGSACDGLYRGIIFTRMADCEGFRYRSYVPDGQIWTEWDAKIPPGSITQFEIKYICT
jgi:hypothetical protein